MRQRNCTSVSNLRSPVAFLTNCMYQLLNISQRCLLIFLIYIYKNWFQELLYTTIYLSANSQHIDREKPKAINSKMSNKSLVIINLQGFITSKYIFLNTFPNQFFSVFFVLVIVALARSPTRSSEEMIDDEPLALDPAVRSGISFNRIVSDVNIYQNSLCIYLQTVAHQFVKYAP